MNATTLYAPEKNSTTYSVTNIKKPVLIKSVQSLKTAVENNAVKSEENTYSFVGIAG